MSSLLYINPLSKNITYIVFDHKKNILESGEVIWYDISISFPEKISELSKKYSFDEVWCIEGPWAFTKMRIVSLVINSLAYIEKNIYLKWAHFFDFLNHISKKTPLLEANKKEFLVQINGENIFYKKEDLPEKTYIWYTSDKNFFWENTFEEYTDKGENIFSYFDTIDTKPRLSPIYIKTPHITCPKK